MSTEASPSFGIINYLVVVGYLGAILALGLWFSSRNTSTNAYFRGGQNVPAIIAGLSIFATLLSSLTFMALPAVAFAGDWAYSLSSLTAYLLVAPLVVFFYIPFFRGLDITSAYEFLEHRFNYGMRLFGSISFMVLQFCRVAIILYLPALALSTVAGIPMEFSIPVVGVLCLVYTLFGGISAVVWTDAIQAVVLLGSAMAAIFVAVSQVEGGALAAWQTAVAEQKFFGRTPAWDGASAGLVLIALGGFFFNLSAYTAQQDVVQRYVTTKDTRDAIRSVWTNSVVGFIGIAIFFLLGTAIFTFYQSHPERLAEGLANDAILPYFIVHELPVGVAGLVVAGIFAASQSSIAGSLNSIATTWIVDIHRRLRPNLDDGGQLRLARWIVGVVGLATIGASYGLKYLDAKSLFDVMLMAGALVTSALGGVFALGIFSRRANGRGAAVGAGLAIVVLLYLWLGVGATFWLYAPSGFLTALITGHLASLFWPAPSSSQISSQPNSP